MAPERERPKSRSGRDREGFVDQRSRFADGATVAVGSGDDPQDVLCAVVPTLELNSSDLALEVVQAGVELGRERGIVSIEPARQDRVPGALIAGDLAALVRVEAADRYFDAHPDPFVEAVGEAAHQRDLAVVTDRRGSWVGAHPDVESDDRPDPRELDDAHRCEGRALDAPDLRRRDPARSAHGLEREAGRDPGSPDVGADRGQVPACDP